MSLFFASILLISLLFTKDYYCFANEDNVWETFQTNNKINENIPKFSETSKQLYESGKERFQVMAREEKTYGECWRKAIQSLHTNCKRLDDEIQSRLALSFANCFLQRSGQTTYPCDDNQRIEDCLRGVSERAFNSYTEFFTHTQSVCFYLQSELWQQNTESTIDRLTQTSVNVKNRLEDASKQLDQLNGLQEMSIGSQLRLNEELIAARDTITEFKTSSAEQRFIVKEILDRFIRLQDFVIVEISYGYSLVFFFVSMIVIYLMTTPVRTNEARLWLFLILVINLIVERLIASYTVDDQVIGLKSTSIIISERIWISRKVTIFFISGVFLWFVFTYKNYGIVNYNILNEHTLRLNNIEHQLSQLLRTDKSMQRMPPFECMADLQKDYFSESGSDFTDDSDYSTDGSDATNASDDTCSTVAIINENKENQRSFTPIQTVSPRTYELRPRKAITYTKNGIIDESVHDFINQIKVSESASKTKRMEQHFKNFFSSDED